MCRAPNHPQAAVALLAWMKNDFTAHSTVPAAKTLVFVNYRYACTNCHWMKANMFTA